MAEISLADRPEVQEKLRRRIDGCKIKVGALSLPACCCYCVSAVLLRLCHLRALASAAAVCIFLWCQLHVACHWTAHRGLLLVHI